MRSNLEKRFFDKYYKPLVDDVTLLVNLSMFERYLKDNQQNGYTIRFDMYDNIAAKISNNNVFVLININKDIVVDYKYKLSNSQKFVYAHRAMVELYKFINRVKPEVFSYYIENKKRSC